MEISNISDRGFIFINFQDWYSVLCLYQCRQQSFQKKII